MLVLDLELCDILLQIRNLQRRCLLVLQRQLLYLLDLVLQLRRVQLMLLTLFYSFLVLCLQLLVLTSD